MPNYLDEHKPIGTHRKSLDVKGDNVILITFELNIFQKKFKNL